MFSENKNNIQPETSSEQKSEKNNTNTNQNNDSRKTEETITIYDEYLECLKNNPEEICKDLKLSFDKTDI